MSKRSVWFAGSWNGHDSFTSRVEDQMYEVKKADARRLKLMIADKLTAPTTRKAAESRLRRLLAETTKTKNNTP
jgi:hypothetical protein